MRIITAVFGLLLLFFSSCKYKNEWLTVPVVDGLTMRVPDWMKDDDELKPGSFFHYSNRFRNVYVVGFKEQSADSFLVYQKNAVDVLRKSLKTPRTSAFDSVDVNGMLGIREEVFGMMEKEHVYYTHITIPVSGSYIQLCGWTRGEDRKSVHQGTIDSVLMSLKAMH